jgi:hypothetical protein
MSSIRSLVAYQLSISTFSKGSSRCSKLLKHLLDVVELALAIGIRVEDSVVYDLEAPRFGVDVDTRDHPYATNHILSVTTPLLTHHLNLGPEALVEHGIERR